jgi:hypothetical protein
MSITSQIDVFRNLRTSTKLFLLCGVFLVSIFVATYGLVVEKLIAIEFVRKELVGSQYLEAVRGVYAWILADGLTSRTTSQTRPSADQVLKRLADAQAHTAGSLHTAELAQSVAEAVRKLSSGPANGEKLPLIVDALTKARNLASRIGDDSNLTLDPDLDSYYVQDIVVTKMPTLLGQVGELQSLLQISSLVGSSSGASTRASTNPGWHDPFDPRRDRERCEGIIPRRCWRSFAADPRPRHSFNGVGGGGLP